MSEDKIRKLLKEAPFSFLGTVERARRRDDGRRPGRQAHRGRAASTRCSTRPTRSASSPGRRSPSSSPRRREGGPAVHVLRRTGSRSARASPSPRSAGVSAAQTRPHLARAARRAPRRSPTSRPRSTRSSLREHAAEATAVVVGRVTALEKARPARPQRARHGRVEGDDRGVPGREGTDQAGHRDRGALREQPRRPVAPGAEAEGRAGGALPPPRARPDATARSAKYQLSHPEDLQPAQQPRSPHGERGLRR